MKEIKLDFETYEEEIGQAHYDGYHEGISKVMKYLESGQRLYDFLSPEDKIRDDSHWGRIAKALGRENELKPKEEARE